MLKKKIFFLLLTYQFCYSQENLSKQDSIFNEKINIYLRKQKDISNNQLIEIGDSLYKNSSNNWQKIKSLFVIIGAYEADFKFKKALHYSLQANLIAEKNNIKYWKTRTSGQVAIIYSKIGLIDESIKYFNKALLYTKDLDRKNELLSRSMILQAQSVTFINQKKLNRSLEVNKEAVEIVNNLKKEFPKDNFQNSSISAFINTATSYFYLQDYINAKIYYKLALEDIKSSKEFDRNFYAHNCIKIAMNELKLEKPDFKFALKYIEEAKNISKILKSNELELEVNTTEADYYRLNHKYKTLDSLNIKINNNYKELTDIKIKSIETEFNESQKKYEIEKKEISKFFLYLYSATLILMVSIILYILNNRKKPKKSILKRTEDTLNSNQNINKSLTNNDKRLMSEEKEVELLNKINEFEKSNYFTQKQFSMAQLSTLLESNPKYINHILINYKKQNFSDYINHLRINFIISELIDNPHLLNYKISYLSEISGFSSHSRFTYIFKKEVNISPSEFILQLKEQNNK